jgi:hypothetical protein
VIHPEFEGGVRDMCVLYIFILHKGASAYCTCTYGGL